MMSEQEFTDIELEKRLQDHYTKHYGEVRRPGDLWEKLSTNIRPNNGIEPQKASLYSTPVPPARPSTQAQNSDWLPLPAEYKPRRSSAGLWRVAAIVGALAIGLVLVWLLSSVRILDRPVAGTPVAATPTVTVAGDVITTVSALSWNLGGQNTWAYLNGVDAGESVEGESSAFIHATSSDPLGAGALEQALNVEKYRGQRIRFSASLKTEGVEGRAALWMQISDAFGVQLSSYEMRDRPITGSTAWQPYTVVLDVPPEGFIARFGAQLEGKGQVWISGARVEVVGQEVPVTASHPPYNLSFEEGLSNWNIGGATLTAPKATVTSEFAHEGKSAAVIDASTAVTSSLGVLGQSFASNPYVGKRVRLSGYVKAQEVEGWAGLWMRVDGRTDVSRRTLAFDNMQNRPVRGTSDWGRYEVVLDVPESASDVVIGALVVGKGTIWLDNLRLEEVDKGVELTGYVTLNTTHNLDFEAGLDGWWSYQGEVNADRDIKHGGNASAHIRAKEIPSEQEPAVMGATFTQAIIADAYRNRNVKISAYVKTRDVEGQVTLVASVAGVRVPAVADSEPVTGTSDWVKREVTVPVPSEGGQLSFGVSLEGEGEVWIDDVQIEVIK
jgi:hypothetical protein